MSSFDVSDRVNMPSIDPGQIKGDSILQVRDDPCRGQFRSVSNLSLR